MKTIYYNCELAEHCGNNGIIKAVLLQYIHNYHKANPRKGAGSPAQISLGEFVFRYAAEEKPLWCRSYIHRTLKELEAHEHLNVQRERNQPVYTVSPEAVEILNDSNGKLVAFELADACSSGLHKAIVKRHLLHMISLSPCGNAYHVNVNRMSRVNRISPAQHYRAILELIKEGVVMETRSPLWRRKRGRCLIAGPSSLETLEDQP
jgi:hypothetical protein